MSTRIHYICINQNCLTDIYADQRRAELITCPVCKKQWYPPYFTKGSWAYGKEEETNDCSEVDKSTRRDSE